MTVFNLNSSKQFCYLLVAAWLVTLVALYLAAIPFVVKVALLGVASCYVIWLVKRYALLHGNAVKALQRVVGGWQIEAGDEWHYAVVDGSSTVTAWVMILRFCVKGRRRPFTCLIFSDALTPSSYRRLLAAIRVP